MAQETKPLPTDPEAARAEIERTRARMSHTIDEIEDILLRKRQRLRERLDIGTKIREKPLQAAGVALFIGLVLGLLTGGDGEQHDPKAEVRAAKWEARARRLLAIARAQEGEIEELETTAAELVALQTDHSELDEGALRDSVSSRFGEYSGRFGDYVASAADLIADGWRRRS